MTVTIIMIVMMTMMMIVGLIKLLGGGPICLETHGDKDFHKGF